MDVDVNFGVWNGQKKGGEGVFIACEAVVVGLFEGAEKDFIFDGAAVDIEKLFAVAFHVESGEGGVPR